MNYLFVLDNCKKYCGANINIAVKLAGELRKRGNSVFLVVIGKQGEVDTAKLSVFNGYTLIKLFNIAAEPIVTNCGNKSKILYGFSHPLFVLKWVFSKKKFWDFKHNIRSIEKKTRIDCILGVSSPFYISQIVSKLKSKAKKLVVQLDPYTNNTTLPESSKNKRMREECKMLSGVDLLLGASPHFKELHALFPKYVNKIKEIELPVMVELNQLGVERKDDGIIRFAYTGMLYKDIRNPEYMLNLFK